MSDAGADPATMSMARSDRMPGDPVLRAMGSAMMTRGTKLTGGAWIAIGLVVVLTAIVTLLQPAFTISGVPVPPLSDRTSQQMLVWSLLAVPVAMYLYFWLPGSLMALIHELRANDVIAGPKTEPGEPIDAFEERSLGRFDNDLWIVPAVILIAVYALVKVGELQSHALPARIQVGLDLLISAPVIYAATLTFFRMIAGIQVTSELFDTYAIRVYPHHPDRAGGLGPIGRRVTILAWAGAAAGTAAFIMNWLAIQKGYDPLESMESVFGVGVLLVVAPLVLWFWLRAPHEAMLAARGEVLGGLSSAYDEVATEPIALNGTRASITKKLQEGTDLLTALDSRADEIDRRYPSWPIHTTAFRTAWAAVAAPLIAGLIGIVLATVRGVVGV